MQTQLRQKLHEIKVMYSLEPSLRDIYVEGDNELYILKWFLNEKKISNVQVYPIDVIELDDVLFERSNLSKHSNQNKVIVVAEELATCFDDRRLKVKCIADADYDRHLERSRRNYILEYTDYTSTEMYFFNEPFLTKFVDLVLHGFATSPADILCCWKNVLQRLFLIRLANESLSWGIKCGDFKSYLSWNSGAVRFQEDRYLTNCLRSNGRGKEIETFKNVMADFEQTMDSDARHNIRGHDFTKLFHIAVKKQKGHRAGFRDLGTFEGTLCGCLQLSFLEGEALFVKLGT